MSRSGSADIRFRIPTVFSIITLLLVAVPAQADLVEQITVTAKKREQNVQDVSIAMTAVSAETLKDTGLTNSNDLGFMLPGVYIDVPSGNQMAKTHIRGSGSVDFNPNAQTTVGVYVDEVYLPNIFEHTMQLFDLQRVEVLRGPQGTLYGRNATAGAINYITAKPQQEFSGYGRLSYGNWNAVRSEGAVTGGLTDTLAARGAFMTENDSGWMTGRTIFPGTTAGSHLNNTDFYSWRGLLSWNPRDDVSVIYNVHGSQDHSNGYTYQFTGTVDPNTFLNDCDATVRNDCIDYFGYSDPDGVEERGDPTKVDSNFHGKADYETIGTNMRVEWQMPTFTVTSITAWDKFQRKHEEDADASPDTISHNFYRHRSKGWSQELRLTSNSEGPWDWIGGFYYGRDRIDSYNSYNFFGFVTFQRFDQEQDSLAGYANLGYRFNDQFKLYGGLRYTSDDAVMHHKSDIYDPPPPAGFGTGLGPFDPGTNGEKSSTDLSWKVGLDYTPNANLLIYGHISKGYKSGGINVGFGDPGEFHIYNPEKLYAYEVGFKSTLWEGRALFNMAAFYYDYRDLQVFDQSTGSFGNLVFVIGNADKAEYYGGEAEFTIKPIDGLEMLFTASYLSTEFTKFVRPLTGADLSGKENVFSPDWKFSGITRYEWETPMLLNGSMAVSVDWDWTAQMWNTVENLHDARTKAHWLLGSRLSWFSSDKKIEVALWGKNLSNAKYRVTTFDFRSVGFNTSVPNRPRSYGVEVGYNW